MTEFMRGMGVGIVCGVAGMVSAWLMLCLMVGRNS